jgi:hypothetical protein
MTDKDPRSPIKQFADYLNIENLGPVQALELLYAANIAREAKRTWPIGWYYHDWLRVWIQLAKEQE